jgi:hypothetical protein
MTVNHGHNRQMEKWRGPGICNISITEEEIINHVNKLKIIKTSNIVGIPSKFIKSV